MKTKINNELETNRIEECLDYLSDKTITLQLGQLLYMMFELLLEKTGEELIYGLKDIKSKDEKGFKYAMENFISTIILSLFNTCANETEISKFMKKFKEVTLVQPHTDA